MTIENELSIYQQIKAEIDPQEYERIRCLWIDHSQAEDRRNIQGLVDTLAETCVYELIPTGQRWEGHDGARAFYTEFLEGFPDVKFDLQDIVIGPQGVIEVAMMTGTHLGKWAGVAATGKQVRLHIIIHFPWNPVVQKFNGEKVYFDRAALEAYAQDHSGVRGA